MLTNIWFATSYQDVLKLCRKEGSADFFCMCKKYTYFYYLGIKVDNANKKQGTKIFRYYTCPAGRVTYNFHSSCKHMHLSFKSVCNKELQGVIRNTTSSTYFSQSTHPTGPVLWEELLMLSRFHS